jgi:hypothetical protein
MPAATTIEQKFNSYFSLQPLVNVYKKMIKEGRPGAKKLYQNLLNEVESRPELIQPMQDVSTLNDNKELVDTLLSTIFPPSSISNEGLYAISFPFRFETIYSSPGFKELFLNGAGEVNVRDQQTHTDISEANLCLALNVIQRKIYKFPVPLTANSVHPFTDPKTGLTKYYELKLNAQFVDVKNLNESFKLPDFIQSKHVVVAEELKKSIPLDNFQFEGLVVIEVTDVTQDHVINEIKTSLLKINEFSDNAVYDELQGHVQSLIGLKGVKIGITPFFKVNEYYLYTEAHYKNSLLFRNGEVISNKDKISELCQNIFRNTHEPVLYESLKEEENESNELLRYYFDQGTRSLILCPLKTDDGNLIGLLEIASNESGKLEYINLSRIQPALNLFTLALEKSAENLELQINKTIKEHFTAVQSAVEWKFTEAAFNYLQYKQISELAKMPTISFDNVFPLYAAIDIRNSSIVRSNSIQLDMLEQLNMVNDVLQKACKISHFPLLKETQFRINRYINSVSENLLTDDEMIIYEFLQTDIDSIFRNLKNSKPELKKVIDSYFNALDPSRKIIYHHRKEYEESITRINDVLDRFIDQEQQDAQEAYPHYFERYVTDGIEFSIYIGQSLSPNFPFNEMYVRNLKLWQLTLLAKAARLTHSLEKKLSMPMQTTQLILAHSIPLSISFRRKERKFDVDGAYNIRYEIVKKRIDKVHIKDSEERLTQPGKIGIVYSQHKEEAEYLEYIEFLQNEKLLGENIEYLDLEDTQGISGLKAIRVDINLSTEETPKVELSNVTSKQLLQK